MKKLIVVSVALASWLAAPAFAGNDMAGMDMSGMDMSSKPSAMKGASAHALTDAEVRKVDPATGMITLKHGALDNVGMPAMTMAFKAKDAAMVRQVKEGDKVRVRVEDVGGTLKIVRLEKRGE
ncbi:copper-binding protein [Paraburkholderia sp. Se-20369]|nr:copper-binding protein [Paraburkholderia sp. Se-20369]